MKTPMVSDGELVSALDRLCAIVGKTSHGFAVDRINGGDQLAIKYTPGFGWMVVCGIGGCGAALSRAGGYHRTRWSLLMALEMSFLVARGIAPEITDVRLENLNGGVNMKTPTPQDYEDVLESRAAAADANRLAMDAASVRWRKENAAHIRLEADRALESFAARVSIGSKELDMGLRGFQKETAIVIRDDLRKAGWEATVHATDKDNSENMGYIYAVSVKTPLKIQPR